MYSTVTGSSTVSRWLWHSTRALLMTILASAVRPETRAEAVRATRHYIRVQGWHIGTRRLSKKQGDEQLGIELPCILFCFRELSLPKLALLKVVTATPGCGKEGPPSPSNCSPLTSLHVSQPPSPTNWSPGLPRPPQCNLYLQRPCRHCRPKRRSSGLFFHLVAWPLIFFPHQEQQCPFLVHQPEMRKQVTFKNYIISRTAVNLWHSRVG